MRTVLLALLLLPAGAAAQEASPYVPLAHWAMPYVEHLIAAGRMADPSPLVPAPRYALLRALAAVAARSSPARNGRSSARSARSSRGRCADRRRGWTSMPGSRAARMRGATAARAAGTCDVQRWRSADALLRPAVVSTHPTSIPASSGIPTIRQERPRHRRPLRRGVRQRAVAPRTVLRQPRSQLGAALHRRTARLAESVSYDSSTSASAPTAST